MSRTLRGLAGVAFLPVLAACSDGGTSTIRVTTSDGGAVSQALAAGPSESFDAICLNVVDVRVRVDADDAEDAASDGWYHLDLSQREEAPRDPSPGDAADAGGSLPDCPLDLAALLRGATIELARGDVPSGELTEIRFVLDDEPGYAIPAGSTWENRIPVIVPSGSQSGLKLKGTIPLEPDDEETIELVFDAAASIREHRGGALRIRPVIHIRGKSAEATDEGGNQPEIELP